MILFDEAGDAIGGDSESEVEEEAADGSDSDSENDSDYVPSPHLRFAAAAASTPAARKRPGSAMASVGKRPKGGTASLHPLSGHSS